MSVRALLLFPLFALACGDPSRPAEGIPIGSNKWSDARLALVLEAQDHRDIKALHVFLVDSVATVREAAAMAFASIQDSTSFADLVPLLTDTDARVRSAVAFALSFSTDSLLRTHLDVAAEHEADSLARQRTMHAAFRAAVNGPHKDALFLISYLESDDPAIRIRAAAMLPRCPKEQLLPQEAGVLHAISALTDASERAFLVLALKHSTSDVAIAELRRLASSDGSAAVRVNALRALGAKADAAFLLDRLQDEVEAVQSTAMDQLLALPAIDGAQMWTAAQHEPIPRLSIPLYGLVMKHADTDTRTVARAVLHAMMQQDLGPYLGAELIKALANDPWTSNLTNDPVQDWLRGLITGHHPAIQRITAFQQAWARIERYPTQGGTSGSDAQHFGPVLHEALISGDAGLVAEAADHLSAFDAPDLRAVLDSATAGQAFASLAPIRDLEARQLLEAALAKRDGKASPVHVGLAFNHPIDRARLATLREGQQYRITTAKGDIVLALEPDAAPGSCVAFDSLVSTGYYDDKYVHRVVPDFVAQGGCPRGDGYGGMDWTLRTEIGYEGFTAGAVGLASAGRDTESCQFFITLMPAPHLDGRYTRFAHVVSGMEVAQRLVVGDRMVRVERMP